LAAGGDGPGELALKIHQAASSMEIDTLIGDSSKTVKDVINEKLNKERTLFDKFSGALNTVLGIIGNKDYKSFSGKYYSPYFSEISRKEFVEVFTYLILSYIDEKDIQDWIYENEATIVEFKKWSESFKWYKPKRLNLRL